MADADITLDDIIESRLIYGSPRNRCQTFAALRKMIGLFGTLLISGMDYLDQRYGNGIADPSAKDVVLLLRKQIA